MSCWYPRLTQGEGPALFLDFFITFVFSSLPSLSPEIPEGQTTQPSQGPKWQVRSPISFINFINFNYINFSLGPIWKHWGRTSCTNPKRWSNLCSTVYPRRQQRKVHLGPVCPRSWASSWNKCRSSPLWVPGSRGEISDGSDGTPKVETHLIRLELMGYDFSWTSQFRNMSCFLGS